MSLLQTVTIPNFDYKIFVCRGTAFNNKCYREFVLSSSVIERLGISKYSCVCLYF